MQVADGDRVDGGPGERTAPPGGSGGPAGAPKPVGQPPEGRSWSVAGLVLAGLGLAMFPIGGLVGIVCGGIARSKGEQSLGLVAIVAGVISFFASFWVAFLVLS
jgi:cation transporter-like permease